MCGREEICPSLMFLQNILFTPEFLKFPCGKALSLGAVGLLETSLLWGCSGRCRDFGSILGLYSLDTSSPSLPSCDTWRWGGAVLPSTAGQAAPPNTSGQRPRTGDRKLLTRIRHLKFSFQSKELLGIKYTSSGQKELREDAQGNWYQEKGSGRQMH